MDCSGRRERKGGGREKEPELQEPAAEFRTFSPHPVFKEAAKNKSLPSGRLPASTVSVPGLDPLDFLMFSIYILADNDLVSNFPHLSGQPLSLALHL